jgi:UDP-N-acetylglucosamine:LPS N-acetylglucosamine transferase
VAPGVLILSASIGEGHDLPARVLADGLAAECPGLAVRIEDGLMAMGWPVDRVVMGGAPLHSKWGNRLFDLEYTLITHVPTRWLAAALLHGLGWRGLARLIAEVDPDIVVSTYPGVTEVLGWMRRRGRLRVPAVSAITDLAALRYWANPDVDLHLVTHPESVEEVRGLAPASRIECVRGLTSPDFLAPRDRAGARSALDLPEAHPIVVVSGGGWAVGDLEGAVEVALAVPDLFVVCLCGRNEAVREQVERRFAGEPRMRTMGFTDRMGDLLAAADVLVHSTAGLTVLEAIIRGCSVISYGWGVAHIRVNNRAFARHDLAEVATSPAALAAAIRRALGRSPVPDRSFEALPSAASVVLETAGASARA